MVVVSMQKEKVNHNFIFKVKFPVQFSSLGNHDFWNLLILKHYLSVKFGWSKCLQEIV